MSRSKIQMSLDMTNAQLDALVSMFKKAGTLPEGAIRDLFAAAYDRNRLAAEVARLREALQTIADPNHRPEVECEQRSNGQNLELCMRIARAALTPDPSNSRSDTAGTEPSSEPEASHD